MIQHRDDSIFNSNAQALVNPVNCVGVMGAGLAREFSRRYPGMFRDYCVACKRGELQVGVPYVWTPLHGPIIVNLPTKYHWREKSMLEGIQIGLANLMDFVVGEGIQTIAIPAIGCGLGGLPWPSVRPEIERYFAPLSVVAYVYGPK